MAENIIQSLRALASKIEDLGEGADRIISNDKVLASDFQKLLKVVPAEWKKSGENRLFSQLQKTAKDISINERHREVIWSWKETHEDFCARQARTTVDPHNTLPLDGLIDGIESDDTELILSSVHWRLSLLAITVVKDVVCQGTTDDTEITKCFQSNGLVSTGKLSYLNKNMRRWLEAGGKYRDLSLKLGGYGSLIYLPDIGRTNYEKYYNPTQQSAFAVIGVLAGSIPRAAAQTFNGIDAHNVVDAIVQSTIDRLNDCRLILISSANVGTQQSTRTTRVEKRRVKNQSSQTRKRSNENSQNTPRSKRVANTNNDNIGARQSEPSAEEVALALWNIRDGRPNLSANERSLPAYRRIAYDSAAEAQRSYNPSANVAGSTTSSTEAAETTSEVDDGSNIMSSERSSVNSMSSEASRYWISSLAAGCNSRIRPVNNGLSAGQADLLPSTFRNQQVASDPIPTMSEEQLSSRQHQYSSATDHVFQPGVSNLDWQQLSNLQETRKQVESGTSLHDNITQGDLPRDSTPALDDFQPPEFELFPQIPEFDLFPQSSSLLDSSSLPNFDVLPQLPEFDLFPMLSTSSALPSHISLP
ncbi:uncharacterized protein BHQ10_007520 [Talaromyces amestolkiae]|uniref:Uncharacterized protein n=1 Tax=Talaromyces amestolkiae TaxID=1196081 RepID=A0A364L6R4_TALAM|nr:uncharacterized protein BHQ10_007520 [Talaromyces amestolkiae]RAO71508.1 hypothetical protein BHQ10_007520 [Talaromyces amestolkiae]